MSDQDALLAAIKEFPGEDTPRVMYADWLQENGQAERAEFIRVQCEYARLYPHFEEHEARGGNECCQRCNRADHLSSLLLDRFKIQRQVPAPFAEDCPSRLLKMKAYHGPQVEWDWYRGFVWSVRCPGPWWVKHGDEIRKWHPVVDVQLLSWPVWEADEDAVWFVGDPDVRPILWLDVIAESTAEEREARDYYHPFLRCRWRGVAIQLPPLIPALEFTRTFLFQVMTAERINEIRSAILTRNDEPMAGYPAGTLLLTEVGWQHVGDQWLLTAHFRPTGWLTLPGAYPTYRFQNLFSGMDEVM